MVKYASPFTKSTLKKKDQRKTYLMILYFFSDFLYKSICCGYSFELHQQVDAIQMGIHNICLYKEAYVVGTHLKCIEKSMQFRWVPTTYAFVLK